MTNTCGLAHTRVTALLLFFSLSATASPPPLLTVDIDWIHQSRRTSTAATVEVDVMPFLARQPATDPFVSGHYGGPFEKYYQALSELNASFVRFAPWCPNPRLVVPELTPPDCTATQPATNWNSTLLDQLMLDFMTAVCGQNAVRGECNRLSVIQQLSTMPSWMYNGGMKLSDVPDNPYIPTPGGHKQYVQGASLVDPTCKTMARHIGRIVGWYTASGFEDDCGHWHASSFNYSWYGLSILNEDEHGSLTTRSLSTDDLLLAGLQPEGGVAYTTCFDAVREELQRINPQLVPIGPEISGDCAYPSEQFDYLSYYLNSSNHAGNYTPLLASYHVGISGDNSSSEAFYTGWDNVISGFVTAADSLLEELHSPTELVLNEFVNSVTDWCDCTGVTHLCPGWSKPGDKCPDWQQPSTAGGDPDLTHAKGVKINRQTWAWNAAAGVFAYAFGTLAERGYLLVGQDQLVAGTFPDNEPTVAMLDWTTGDRNAKYFVTQLLASTVGAAVEKSLFSHTISVAGDEGFKGSDVVYVLPFQFTTGSRGVLLLNKKAYEVDVKLSGVVGSALFKVVEVAPAFGGGAGFQPPQERELSPNGVIHLGPFAVAVSVDVKIK